MASSSAEVGEQKLGIVRVRVVRLRIFQGPLQGLYRDDWFKELKRIKCRLSSASHAWQ